MNFAAASGTLRALAGTVLLATVISCSGSPNASGPNGGGGNRPVAQPGVGQNPGQLPQAAPLPQNAAPTAQVQFNDPNNLPFVDPTTEAGRATNRFFEGGWTVNGGYLEQTYGATTSSLTFRQYAGNAFGSNNGVAPAKYRADVTVWVYQPSVQYPDMVGKPLGILGYAPYFLDETRYLLVVAKPTRLEAWVVDGQVPGSEWPLSQQVWGQDLATPLAVGSPVAWSVQVDTTTNSATIWANGEQKSTVTHPLLSNRGQRVSLVSNGNFVRFQDFKLFTM